MHVALELPWRSVVFASDRLPEATVKAPRYCASYIGRGDLKQPQAEDFLLNTTVELDKNKESDCFRIASTGFIPCFIQPFLPETS